MLMFDLVDLNFNSVFIIVLVILFLLQFILCLKVDIIFLKLIPLILSFIVCTVFLILFLTSVGWDQVGYLLLIIYASILFIACFVSCIISSIIKKIFDL